MDTLFVVLPKDNISPQLNKMINSICENFEKIEIIKNFNNFNEFKDKKILFALEIDFCGTDISMFNILNDLENKNKRFFYNSTACLVVHSNNDLYTKDVSQQIIFLANSLGCRFLGHPLVEATGSLRNFSTWKKATDKSIDSICLDLCDNLGKRLLKYKPLDISNPKILVLYSSPHSFSNTLSLWRMTSLNLKGFNIKEIQIENGDVKDCKGCSYKMCMHYGKQNSCFYGGLMVENILPSIEKADVVVWLCPNYNDAISANISATINRLTVLYRKINFYNKSLFGVVVSGNSGSDSVCKQLLGALNINKGFTLPPYSMLIETANDPKSIYKVDFIEEKAKLFANNMKSQIKYSNE
ncbi:flavodoxin family protein [Clostridium oceanicum]|uniref:NAD(P)H-dependent oxidoreductase n=1 Tax=Clostridium oceanicum TaxID=1543 RepID=A0ABP3V2X6_9CLOT